jgi:hypothetical protein
MMEIEARGIMSISIKYTLLHDDAMSVTYSIYAYHRAAESTSSCERLYFVYIIHRCDHPVFGDIQYSP